MFYQIIQLGIFCFSVLGYFSQFIPEVAETLGAITGFIGVAALCFVSQIWTCICCGIYKEKILCIICTQWSWSILLVCILGRTVIYISLCICFATLWLGIMMSTLVVVWCLSEIWILCKVRTRTIEQRLLIEASVRYQTFPRAFGIS